MQQPFQQQDPSYWYILEPDGHNQYPQGESNNRDHWEFYSHQIYPLLQPVERYENELIRVAPSFLSCFVGNNKNLYYNQRKGSKLANPKSYCLSTHKIPWRGQVHAAISSLNVESSLELKIKNKKNKPFQATWPFQVTFNLKLRKLLINRAIFYPPISPQWNFLSTSHFQVYGRDTLGCSLMMVAFQGFM